MILMLRISDETFKNSNFNYDDIVSIRIENIEDGISYEQGYLKSNPRHREWWACRRPSRCNLKNTVNKGEKMSTTKQMSLAEMINRLSSAIEDDELFCKEGAIYAGHSCSEYSSEC